MNEILWIEPAISSIALATRSVSVAEIRLGGLSRGAVLVLCEVGQLDTLGSTVLNAAARHGYEGVAVALGADAPSIDDGRLTADATVVLGRLAARGWAHEQIGAIGYGLGARTALLLASATVLGAAVSVSTPGLTSALSPRAPALAQSLSGVRTPWLGISATTDLGGPSPEQLHGSARFCRESAAQYSEWVTYQGVDPTFYLDTPQAGRHAASDSWQRTVEWLDRRVVPRPSVRALAWARRHAA